MKSQYLCVAAIVIFIIIVIASFADNYKLVEGMSADPQIIKNAADDIRSELNTSAKRNTLEDVIIALEDNISLSLLLEVNNNSESISRNPIEAQDAIVKINNLKAFKDSLNDAMATLDKN